LYGLYMTGSGEGWAVGAQGAIWHASGGVWAPAASPTTSNLNAVALDSPTHGWAVGGGYRWYTTTPPVLLEYTGGRWVDRTSSIGAQAPAFFGLALQPGGAEGWAVGEADYYLNQRAIF